MWGCGKKEMAVLREGEKKGPSIREDKRGVVMRERVA